MKRLALALSAIVVAVVVSSCAVGVRQSASDITTTSATLNGKVLSTTGGPGSWYIEYGPPTARTERTPTRTIDFAVGQVEPVSEPVDGLEPGTTYHFAVCAEDSENPGEPFCSPDQTFTTAPSKDSVVGTATLNVGVPQHPLLLTYEFNAFSGPSGEDPTGTIQVADFTLDVVCLAVSGTRAVVGAHEVVNNLDIYYVINDGAVDADALGQTVPPGGQPADDCANVIQEDITLESVFESDVVVTDARPSAMATTATGLSPRSRRPQAPR
jgi:hypothetical protein